MGRRCVLNIKKEIYHNKNENLETNDDFSVERKHQRTHSYESEKMWKIIEVKGLVDQAFELEKGVKRQRGSGRIAKKSVEVVDLATNKTKYFPSLSEASEYFGKTRIYFIYNNGSAWENKKITIVNH